MQAIVTFALLMFFVWGAHAQTFPGGSGNVEINLDALKPMENSYEPPQMFDAPLTNLDDTDKKTGDPAETAPEKKPKYFDPPPVPPKRPETLRASKDFIKFLSEKNSEIQNTNASPALEAINIDTTPVNNDINADVVQMDARSVLNSIEGRDLTEDIDLAGQKEKHNHPGTLNKTVPVPENARSIEFDIDITEIGEDDEDFLKNNIVPVLAYNPAVRLEIRSYASPNIEERNARRTSLARALNIRKFLELQGISKGRITIRALGDKTEETSADRADLLFLTE